MSIEDIIRAWKDEDFRDSLDKDSSDMVPKNPAGLVELPEGELRNVAGAGGEEPDAVTGWVCVLTLACLTAGLSCLPSCSKTVVGTCAWFTAACC